jgi:hypothetical protein
MTSLACPNGLLARNAVAGRWGYRGHPGEAVATGPTMIAGMGR